MPKFMITFGQRHPLRDNWIEIEAPDEALARLEIISVIGKYWAFSYEEALFEPKYFPGGRVGKVIEVK